MSEADAYAVARRAGMLLVDQRAAIERRDAILAAEADADFHLLLCSSTPNGMLRSLAAALVEHMHHAALAVYSLADAATRSLEQHEAMVDRLAAGDCEGAASLLAEHAASSRERFAAALPA